MTLAGKTPRLRYDEGCLAAHALNVIGDRWALLVVRELMFRPKRFQTLRAVLPGISAAVLAQRLRQLLEAGVLSHDAEAGAYALTPSGRELGPVLVALCRWGVRQPGHDPRRFISPTALMISMTAMINAVPPARRGLVAGIASPRDVFTVSADAAGRLQVAPALAPEVQFTLTGDGNALARAIYGSKPLAELAQDDGIALAGDLDSAQHFADLFSLRRR